MSNLRIVSKNALDHPSCALSCSVAVTLPLANLQSYSRGRIARIPCNPAFEIKLTWGGAGVYASMASMHRHNIEPAGTWRFQGYTAAADWTGANVDSGTIAAVDSATLGDLDFGVEPLGSGIFDPFYGQKMSKVYFTRSLFLSAKYTITDTGNSQGVIDLSRLWLGDYYSLAWNFAYGFKLGWKEDTQHWATDGGGVHADAGVPYRQLTFDLQGATEADRAQWMDILRYCGARKDVFVDPFPSGTGEQARDYAGDYLIVPPLPDLTTTNLGQNTTNITLREV